MEQGGNGQEARIECTQETRREDGAQETRREDGAQETFGPQTYGGCRERVAEGALRAGPRHATQEILAPFYRRASKMRLNGVAVARRNCRNPPSVTTS